MLTHIDSNNKPSMVDISDKEVTSRVALAFSKLRFPADIARELRQKDFTLAKGPVFSTAIIAGVMAAKRTSELIPFCHPIQLDDCSFEINMTGDDVDIECRAAARSRTGVEMEALAGASIAALTIYDMCKALSHDIEIVETRVIHKRGGKSDIGDDE